MEKIFTYKVTNTWTGNQGQGTSEYNGYARSHKLSAHGKPDILASSEPAFRGDPARWNPEEMLLASLSSCHMLWYLHLCADAKVRVISYTDNPEGNMVLEKNGAGAFRDVTLHPEVTVENESMIETAESLHKEAHRLCFIANSVNFPVGIKPTIKAQA